MKRLTMTVLLAAVAGWAWALAPMPETLDRAEALRQARERTAKDAPDAKTLTLAQARYVAYAPDGSSTLWIEFWSKALTEAGAQELRDVPLWYKEGFSEAEFQVAEVIRADGSAEPVDLQANVRAATSNSGNAANIYDPTSKRLVLTVPKVAVGDTLHVVLAQQTNKPRIPDTYSDFETFEDMEGPIPYASLTILAPKELPLRSVALMDEVPGTVTASQETRPDGRVLHRWVARNVPQTFAEENMPEASTEVQRVAVSTFPSWEAVSKWYWELCVPHLKTTPAIDAKVRELTAGKTPAEQVEALFGFVAQGIRYMGIIAEDKAPGYEPHDVALTFDNRYGVCRDKGALLVAMLRKAGLEAFPVLINAGSKRDKEVPIPYFNHAIVAIAEGDGYRLLDPTDDTARAELPAYLSDCTYLVCRPEGDTLRLTPTPAPEGNLMDIVTEGALDAAGTLELTATLRFGGVNDNVYRPLFVKNPPDRVRDRFDGFLKRVVPGAALVGLEVSPKDAKDISQPLEVRLTARVPGYAVPDAEGRTPVELPFLSRAFGLVNFLFDGLDQPTRKYDWVIAAPCAARERLTLRGLGRLGAPTLLPDDPILKANGASYDVVCRRADDGTLTLTRELALSHKTYTPEDYRSLRRFAERLRRFESLRPLFTKAPGQDDDALVLKSAQETTLEEGAVLRRHLRDTRILTFQGKRALGERKLWHCPAWQELTLNAAETITAQGDRVAVTPKEISALDADGAALAPRYPALRKTVVSLPAVEVGATTRMDWQIRSRDNRPFCESIVFGGAYPTEEQRYTLTLPLARDADLRVAERNFGDAEVTRTVVTNGATVVRAWTLRNLPAVRPESRTPEAALWRPTLHVALREAAAFRTFPGLIAKAEAALKEGSKQAAATAEALTEGLGRDVEAKLRALQTFMAQRIRTLGTAWDDLPFGTVTAPDAVLAEGYGNRLDRLLLWLAMLRAADIKAELVFAGGNGLETAYLLRDTLAAREVPRWTRWRTPYLRLADGRLIGDEGELDAPGATALGSRSLMTTEGRALYDQPEALRSRAQQTIRVVVRPDGDATLSAETFRWGLEAGAMRRTVRDFTPETRRRAIAATADALATGSTPCSEFVADVKAYPVRTRLAVEAKGYAVRQGRVLSIPVEGLTAPLFGLRGVRRENPIWQGAAKPSERVYDLWLPAGVEILTKPEPFTVTLPGGGSYALTLETAVMPHTGLVRLTYRTRHVAAPALLGSWIAPALEELDRRLSAPNMKSLILRLPE